MKVKLSDHFGALRWLVAILFLIALMPLAACSNSSDPPTGTFVDSPVDGLTYTTPTKSGITDMDGTFRYKSGETVTFSIGDLLLGSAPGKATISPVDIVSGAADATNQVVNNICVLLQSLDQDGNLNNGIQITTAIAAIVSDYAGRINFDQTTSAFAADTSLSTLFSDLNAADPAIFTDLDPRDRTIVTAAAARDHLNHSLANRSTVATTYGDLRGFEVNDTTWAWYGVPYAAPPVGDLRWKPPAPLESWSGVREATAWGDQAAQYPLFEPFGLGGMSEDCLYLNITAPKDASNLPVMVWFHGGGFTILTSNSESFNTPDSLTTKGVVLVTVSHRLGPFGYMAHPLLTAESDYNGSGNYGQMDLMAALEWIQDNIAAFGGNPDNVTLFGQSGGGGKALWLMASPLATGLFNKVICESGMGPVSNPLLIGTDLTTAEAKGTALFTQLGVTTLAEARAISWTDIMAAVDVLYPPIGLAHDITTYMPNVDNHYITGTMDELIQAPMPNDVPLMAGANGADVVAGIDLSSGISDQMPLRNNNSGATHYVYKWDHVPADWASAGVGAYHGIELVYVFNYPAGFAGHYILGLTSYQPSSIPDYDQDGVVTTLPAIFDYEDIAISSGYYSGTTDSTLTDRVMTLWTNFAKTGNPSIDGIVDWTAYTTANDAYLEIGSGGTFTMATGLDTAFP